MIRLLATLLLFLGLAAPAAADPWDRGGAIPPSQTGDATLPDPSCTQSYANDARMKGPRLRFGIGPRLAGEGGNAQTTPTVPEDFGKRDAALEKLRGDRFFAVRLNRLFMADGEKGIADFKALADRFTKLGIEVELQVRYHPAGRRRQRREVAGLRAPRDRRLRAQPARNGVPDHERGQPHIQQEHLGRLLQERGARARRGR